MRRLIFEKKIMGINALLIFASLTAVVALLAYFGGELLNLSNIGFEVIYPYMTTIAVGEWGKTRSDTNFDIIAAQSKSLFEWVVIRFWAVFLTGSLFAFIGMVIVFLIRREIAICEMEILYFPPAFFLSTLCAFFGISLSREHTATLITGIYWILSMLARSLLRIPGVEYVYLFIRFAGDANDIWLMNKIALTLLGLGFWIVIYLLCRKRVFIE